jgi:hypothetical protein
MNSRTRMLLWGVVAAALLAGGLYVGLRSRTAPSSPAAADTSPGRAVTIKRPVMQHTEGEELAWQIQLKEIELRQGGSLVSAEGVQEALIYGESGEPRVRVTAERVEGTASGDNFTVTGEVTMVSYQGVVLRTNRLHWDQAREQVICPEEVTARSAEMLFSTRELTYDLSSGSLQAPQQVNFYSGENKLIGQNLRYDLNTKNWQMDDVQILFNAEEARELLRRGI